MKQLFIFSTICILVSSCSKKSGEKDYEAPVITHNSGAEYLHVHIHPESKSYAYNQTFAVEAGTSYKIKIIAEDPSANSASKQVEVSCN